MVANTDLKQLDHTMNSSSSADREAQVSDSDGKRGGWITFPFLAGTVLGLTLASMGSTANLIVYLIQEFHVMSIDAVQIANVVAGCSSLFPIVGAVIADSFFGSFFVISLSSSICLLGMICLALTASIDSLRPPKCEMGSSLCKSPTKLQFAVLYAGVAMGGIGLGGTRFTVAAMGANQFNKPKHKGIFFNWYFFLFYFGSVISYTAIVYIQDNISWKLGYLICTAANLFGLVMFLLGNRFYIHDKPQRSPFVDLARVVVAALRKRKIALSSRVEDYYNQSGEVVPDFSSDKIIFRFLNRAALKTEGDINPEGKITNQWKLVTIQQVEDLKTLIKLFPLWSTNIFLDVTIGLQMSIVVLQALTMDRHISPNFKIPASSILVIILISAALFISLIDRLIQPTWQKLTGRPLTPVQQIGAGHVMNLMGVIVSALVESKRLKIAHEDRSVSVVPMMVLWLFPQLVLVGIGEAFHFPGRIGLLYQEFPVALKSTSTAMVALLIGIAFYLSTAVIDLVRKVSDWLPADINHGRIDNLYWTMVAIAVTDLVYLVVCSKFYRYRNADNGGGYSSDSDNTLVAKQDL